MLPRLLLGLVALCASAEGSETAFSRIIRGWTNYSTGFATTHDLDAGGDFATAASFFTPPYTVRALDFGVVLIWDGPSPPVNFANFAFSLCFWTRLQDFVGNPRQGDLANLSFARPDSAVVDTFTRGGRPAYEVRFALTNATVILSNCQTYLIGLIAHTDPVRYGEFFVPTARSEGPSDVQAGNIVPFGWQYLIDAGGLTIYHGQLATELLVEPMGVPPSLSIAHTNSGVLLSWPIAASCYGLEAAETLSGPWLSITNQPASGSAGYRLRLPVVGPSRFFRLRTPAREPEPEPDL